MVLWHRNSLTVIVTSFFLFGAAESAYAGSGKFGVIIGGGDRMPAPIKILKDVGATWVRVNNHLDGRGTDISQLLAAGFNVVITFDHHDVSNIITTYGSPAQFIHAGFPFSSKDVYQRKIREVLEPLLPYLVNGRKIMAQCENEISDASLNSKARYWRGTVDQYVVQLDACYDAVKSVDASIPVVLSSFASEALSSAIHSGQNSRLSGLAGTLITTLLTKGRYDVADLHFYGCVGDIAPKAQWVQEHMPAGKGWISTENGGPDYRCSSTSIRYEQDPEGYEQLEADQVPQRLSACAEHGASVCLWFSLFDLRGEEGVFSHMGLLEVAGSGSGGGMPRGQRSRLREMMNRGGSGDMSAEQRERFMNALRKKPAYDAFQSFVASH